MATRSIFLIVCILFITSFALAGENGVTFLYPTEGLTLNYLDTINVTYLSGFEAPVLYLFCSNITSVTRVIQQTVAGVDTFNGSAMVVLAYLGGSPCWFDLRPNFTAAAGLGANSPSFTLVQTKRAVPTTFGLDDLAATTTSSLSSPTLSTSATITSSSQATTTGESDSTSSTTPSTASSSSSSKKIVSDGGAAAIGIVIGLLVCTVGAAVVYFVWRRKRKGRATATQALGEKERRYELASMTANQNTRTIPNKYIPKGVHSYIKEMPSESGPQEIEGSEILSRQATSKGWSFR